MCVCEWIRERSSRNHMKFLNHYTYNRIVHCQTLSANRVGFRLCHICIGDALLGNLPNLPDEVVTKVKRRLAWCFKNNVVCFSRQTTREEVD